jgi:3-phenylpropionate/cinnamic acid dioxygenase small subunit
VIRPFDPALKAEIDALYADYAERLDDGPLESWPALFTEDCLYLLVPRDNFDRGLPLATMRCESRAMLNDRIRAVRETIMHEPRYLRHHITNARGESHADGTIEVRANFSIIEVLPDQLPRLLLTGRYLDLLVRGADGVLRFAEKRCVYDSVLVPNTIVVPA